jgi:NAD(P)-dependent dehydrogenase (short-subunit alcohol dehydrogenase family)
MNRVKDKIIVVTGAGSGIGEATCLLAAREGAKVAVTGRDPQKCQRVVDQITKEGGVAKFWHLDTADEKEVDETMRSIHETFGRIDGLVNNAGVGGTTHPTHKVTTEEWDSLMNVNLKGVFFCTRAVLPMMIEDGGGSIVNVSSIAGLVGTPTISSSAYSASKGAVRLLTKADAMAYAKKNIRVNSVHPGAVWTPIFQPAIDRGLKREDFERWSPMGRVADPMEIAYGILFLASDESSFMTGSELVMDGGLTAG